MDLRLNYLEAKGLYFLALRLYIVALLEGKDAQNFWDKWDLVCQENKIPEEESEFWLAEITREIENQKDLFKEWQEKTSQ